MQAVAVGASVAYPLLRAARAIPVPILMIGAGLFFAGSKTGRDLTQQASDKASDLADIARQRTQDLSDQIARTVADARDYASGALDTVTSAIADGAEQFRHTGDTTGISRPGETSNLQTVRDATEAAKSSAIRGVSNLQDRATAIASDTSASIQDKISDVSSALRQSATEGKQAGREFLTNTRDRVSDVSQRASRTINDTIAENPLLVAGVGLVLGGLIASALPKFQVENSLLGGTSSAVKKRAQAHGVEAAKGAADEILGKVAQQARAEGLTPDALARGAQERIQRVAERAVTTAFDPDTENH